MPALDGKRYGQLLEDIAANGVQVPIIQDEHGNVIDGHHRVRAVHDLRSRGVDVADPPRITLSGLSEDERAMTALRLNVHRRQLTDAQRVILADKLREYIARIAAARIRHEDEGGPVENLPQGVEPPEPGERTRDALARMVGYGTGRTLDKDLKTLQGLREMADAGNAEAAKTLEAGASGAIIMDEMEKIRDRLRREQARVRAVERPGPIELRRPTRGAVQESGVRIAVPMTRAEYEEVWRVASTLPAWHGFRDCMVSVSVPEEMARSMAERLPDNLARAFAAAIDMRPMANGMVELSSDEMRILRRVRRTREGQILVEVHNGKPAMEPSRDQEWRGGKTHDIA